MTVVNDHPWRDSGATERTDPVTEPVLIITALLADDHYLDRLAAGRLPAGDDLSVTLYTWCQLCRRPVT